MRSSLFPMTVVLIAGSQLAFGQLAVQEPVVGNFGVNTTVSVPDRGGAFLGGVGSGTSSRTVNGPLRTGSSRSSSLSNSSVSVHARIIDLHEMDEAILNSVPDPVASNGFRPRVISAANAPPAETVASTVEKMQKFEKLAQQSESSGNRGVAKLHWQMAAKYGSKMAATKLAATTSPTAISSKATAQQ